MANMNKITETFQFYSIDNKNRNC